MSSFNYDNIVNIQYGTSDQKTEMLDDLKLFIDEIVRRMRGFEKNNHAQCNLHYLQSKYYQMNIHYVDESSGEPVEPIKYYIWILEREQTIEFMYHYFDKIFHLDYFPASFLYAYFSKKANSRIRFPSYPFFMDMAERFEGESDFHRMLKSFIRNKRHFIETNLMMDKPCYQLSYINRFPPLVFTKDVGNKTILCSYQDLSQLPEFPLIRNPPVLSRIVKNSDQGFHYDHTNSSDETLHLFLPDNNYEVDDEEEPWEEIECVLSGYEIDDSEESS